MHKVLASVELVNQLLVASVVDFASKHFFFFGTHKGKENFMGFNEWGDLLVVFCVMCVREGDGRGRRVEYS